LVRVWGAGVWVDEVPMKYHSSVVKLGCEAWRG